MTNTSLIVTNSTDETADYLESGLRSRGHDVVRFDTDQTATQTTFDSVSKDFTAIWNGRTYRPLDIGSVIYRRPRPLTSNVSPDLYLSNHAANEWAEAIEAFFSQIPFHRWINHPTSNVGASHKIDQLLLADRSGLSVPSTLVTSEPNRAREFVGDLSRRVIVKPLSSGYIERAIPSTDTIIYTNEFKHEHLGLLTHFEGGPVLFQERINKILDVRVTVVDDEMTAISMQIEGDDGLQRLDVRRDNMIGVRYKIVELPDAVKSSISFLMAHYKLRFAAMDFAVDSNGKWIFFEINPNGQWAWFDLLGVSNIIDSFFDTVIRARD